MSGCGDSNTSANIKAENAGQVQEQSSQTVINNVVNSTPVATFDTFAINKEKIVSPIR